MSHAVPNAAAGTAIAQRRVGSRGLGAWKRFGAHGIEYAKPRLRCDVARLCGFGLSCAPSSNGGSAWLYCPLQFSSASNGLGRRQVPNLVRSGRKQP